jgi:hypothetical protein
MVSDCRHVNIRVERFDQVTVNLRAVDVDTVTVRPGDESYIFSSVTLEVRRPTVFRGPPAGGLFD